MWHEARRHEKDIRRMQIDVSKRAERRKKFYENIRKDPSQFMQIHGRQATIYTEKSVAKAAEDNVLHKWQGDPEVLIDRFDVRAHLDHIPVVSKSKVALDSAEEREELVCDFERYRIIIMNECRRISDEQYLKKIAMKEFWLDGNRAANDTAGPNKKKSGENKSAIHFSYDDSDVVTGREDEDIDEDEEEDVEELEDLDAEIEISKLDPEAIRKANKWGEMYGIQRSLFISLLKADQQSTKDTAELRRIERQKIALAGREGKAERMILKKRRQEIVGKSVKEDEATVTLLSFVRKKDAENEKMRQFLEKERENRSSSSSSEEEDTRPEFISTFGGAIETRYDDDEDEEESKAPTHGPELPSEQFRKILEMKKRVESPDKFEVPEDVAPRERTRSRSRSGRRRRSRSRSRSRRRSNSRDARRRSRSRSRRSRDRRSRDRSRDRRRRSRSRNRSRDRRRSRSRSRSRDHHRRSRSSSRGRRSYSRDGRSRKRRRTSSSVSRTPVRRRVDGGSPPRPAEESDGAESMLEIRSSMSDSEKEKLEIENRKRRIRRTKRMVKQQGPARSQDNSDTEEEKREEARKLRLLMQKKMRKTEEQLRAEEDEKARELERERRIREEELLLQDERRKQRERERREQMRETERNQDKEDRESRRLGRRDRERDRSRDRRNRSGS